MKNTPLREGLSPQPPDLTQARSDPAEAFSVIKHGIKMSGMPAWGTSHDDDTLWSIVAFLDKLPRMTAQEYQAITAKAPPDANMKTGSAHGGPADGHGGSHGGGKPQTH